MEKYVLPIFQILPLTVQPSKPRLCHEERLHIYHNLGLAVTSAARSQGGSCVPIYIGDRHIGPLFGSPAESSLPPSRSLAETMYHVLPTYRGRLFYWHREIAGLMFLTDNQVLKPALDYDGCNQ